jgi:hypothetical protein
LSSRGLAGSPSRKRGSGVCQLLSPGGLLPVLAYVGQRWRSGPCPRRLPPRTPTRRARSAPPPRPGPRRPARRPAAAIRRPSGSWLPGRAARRPAHSCRRPLRRRPTLPPRTPPPAGAELAGTGQPLPLSSAGTRRVCPGGGDETEEGQHKYHTAGEALLAGLAAVGPAAHVLFVAASLIAVAFLGQAAETIRRSAFGRFHRLSWEVDLAVARTRGPVGARHPGRASGRRARRPRYPTRDRVAAGTGCVGGGPA